jgi:arylformamidase
MIHDLTPPIDERLAVWPGDTAPNREILLDINRGDAITLSTLHATCHLGAHADGPSHYSSRGASIDQRNLDPYLGLCQVVRVTVAPASHVQPKDVRSPILAPRVLFSTQSFPDPRRFNEDFAALSVELIDGLAAEGVRLVGIDTPSVDLFSSKDLPAHQACLKHDLSILEGVVLKNVPDGLYELIALPLPLVGFDASPVRAILRTLPGA